jgi:hypothetical protein
VSPFDATPRKRVAVMQPYFLPYAGFFRLLAGVDEFVLFDCVQFPRRGRVHRTEVPAADGGHAWLTLPLASQPREVLIRDLAFAADARASFDRRLEHLAWLRQAQGPAADTIRALLRAPLDDVMDFLETTLVEVGALLGFQPRFLRSSTLGIDPALRGQDRVIAIARATGASHYLNAPGGRPLYDPASFADAGLALEFLTPYAGPNVRMLPALVTQAPESLRADVLATLSIERAWP